MTAHEGGGPRGESERIAPVIPLFGGGSGSGRRTPAPIRTDAASLGVPRTDIEEEDAGSPSERHPARGTHRAKAPSPAPIRALKRPLDKPLASDVDTVDEYSPPDPEQIREVAEEGLVRKLRTRQLSVSEARQVLRTHGLSAQQMDEVVDDFLRRRYLDDDALARSLVMSGVDRKGQGRVALSRALAQRGISRDVIAVALDELPDDDAERALEYARTKARSLSRLDPDTALRRLVGQLARRGYGGAVAMSAAKSALAEASSGGRTTGVRFVDSD